MTTPAAKEETPEQIAESIIRRGLPYSIFTDGEDYGSTKAWLVNAVAKALRNERERNCRLLCEFCGNDEYNVIWHHEEWRHYRQRDMYVEYCKAAVLRGLGEGSK